MLVTKENPYPLQSRSHMRQIRAESGPRGPAKSGTIRHRHTHLFSLQTFHLIRVQFRAGVKETGGPLTTRLYLDPFVKTGPVNVLSKYFKNDKHNNTMVC